MSHQCIAIKASGHQCDSRVGEGAGMTRCVKHRKSIKTNGPHAQQLKEMGYTHKRELKDLEDGLVSRFHNRWENVTHAAREEYHEAVRRMKARHDAEKHDLIHRQVEEVHRDGVNPDADAIRYKAERKRLRNEKLFERAQQRRVAQEAILRQEELERLAALGVRGDDDVAFQIRQDRDRAPGWAMIHAINRVQRDEEARIDAHFAGNVVGHIQRALDAQAHNEQGGVAPGQAVIDAFDRIQRQEEARIAGQVQWAAAQVQRAQQGELAVFVNDRQNVHTSAAVKQTKEIVERIRKIPVPEDYRWHATESSKTPFEIGMECKLSQRAAWQMISQYAQDTAIYDIEAGIYGKVLDSVWQYVKNSPDKADLCVIIKSEMEDNIGMCAQGNLSRICNILAGILEGVGSQESLSERLGRLFGPLLEIDDHRDRIARGINILSENHVPVDEWSAWMDPLKDIEA